MAWAPGALGTQGMLGWDKCWNTFGNLWFLTISLSLNEPVLSEPCRAPCQQLSQRGLPVPLQVQEGGFQQLHGRGARAVHGQAPAVPGQAPAGAAHPHGRRTAHGPAGPQRHLPAAPGGGRLSSAPQPGPAMWFVPGERSWQRDGVVWSQSRPGCRWVEFALKCLEVKGLSHSCGAQGKKRRDLGEVDKIWELVWFGNFKLIWNFPILGVSLGTEDRRFEFWSRLPLAVVFLLPAVFWNWISIFIFYWLLNQRWQIVHVQLGPHHRSWYVLFRYLWVKSQDILSRIKSEI